MSRPIDLDRFFTTDPRDLGCDHAIELLDVYAELAAVDPAKAEERFPAVAVHLHACGPCAEDLHALLDAIRADTQQAE